MIKPPAESLLPAWAELKIGWHSDEVNQWRTRSYDSLDDWIKSDSEMLVRCTSGFFCRKPAILTLNDLKRYAAMGISLEDLKTRFKCSKCGKRGASIAVF